MLWTALDCIPQTMALVSSWKTGFSELFLAPADSFTGVALACDAVLTLFEALLKDDLLGPPFDCRCNVHKKLLTDFKKVHQSDLTGNRELHNDF
jgi:hypothetical protein